MKAIYFSQNKAATSKSWSRNLLQWGSETLTEHFPRTSLKLSEHLLCRPTRPKRQRALDESFERHEILVHGQRLRLYRKGNSDRAIVFSHGWSGQASNFKRFMREALEQGFSVWAIDHLGHGESQGEYANFFLFVAGLEEAFRYIRARDAIVGMVGHSMGSSAIISAKIPSDIPVVLLAPVIPFFENMQEIITGFGISQKTLMHLFKEIEQRVGRDFADIDPQLQWSRFANRKLVFHDVEDKYIALEKNLASIPSSDPQTELNVTQGLGHFRILHDSAVIYQSLDFLRRKV